MEEKKASNPKKSKFKEQAEKLADYLIDFPEMENSSYLKNENIFTDADRPDQQTVLKQQRFIKYVKEYLQDNPDIRKTMEEEEIIHKLLHRPENTRLSKCPGQYAQKYIIKKLLSVLTYPEENEVNEEYYEGHKVKVEVNKYERDRVAREICIKKYGYKCYVCGFDFLKEYGEIGQDFIHIHHLKPLSEIGHEYQINPLEDLRPVCPNCHAMIHRKKPPYTIEELQEILQKKHQKCQ